MTRDHCRHCHGDGQYYDRLKGFTVCCECRGTGGFEREMTTDEAIEHLLSRI